MEKLPFTQYNFSKRSEEDYLNGLKNAGFDQVKITKHEQGIINFNGSELKNEFLVVSAKHIS